MLLPIRISVGLMGLASAIGLGACSQSDSIDPDGAKFDAISPQAQITLIGTEPGWGMDISQSDNGDHIARFSSTDDIEGSTFAVTRFAGNNGLGFTGTLGDKSVQVAITPGDCSDGMSDRLYPFVATAALGETALLGCAYTDGVPFEGSVTP